MPKTPSKDLLRPDPGPAADERRKITQNMIGTNTPRNHLRTLHTLVTALTTLPNRALRVVMSKSSNE